MIKNILTYPLNKEILTSKSVEVKEINEEIKTLIQDLKDTLNLTKSGVGISAIQIGVPKKVCIVKYNNKEYVLINPIITKRRGETEYKEGCLSAPGCNKLVKRSQKVWVEYLDENGIKREEAQGGLFSIIVQHELDHFNGWCEVFNELL